MTGIGNITSRQSWLLVAIAAVLLTAQGLSGIHAAKFGDKPHDHHGQPCVVSVISEQGDKTIAAAAFIFAVLFVSWATPKPAQLVSVSRDKEALRQPRAPPVL